jgi:hypothetical protein
VIDYEYNTFKYLRSVLGRDRSINFPPLTYAFFQQDHFVEGYMDRKCEIE